MPRPHAVNPEKSTVRVILAIKNFAAIQGVCHIGLGVTALNTMKVLQRNGVFVESWATQTYKELAAKLLVAERDRTGTTSQYAHIPITHVIVSAPSWIQPEDFQELALTYPHIEFVQLNHSGCAFLSIDKYGIRNIKAATELQLALHNFRIAGNNSRFTNWVARGLNSPCLHLPNLYDTESFLPVAHQELGDTLRIGSFGASRPWKNQLTASEAAVQLARTTGRKLEFYVNSKRPDGGERMIESREELFDGLRDAKLIYVPWERWPKFRQTVGHMHLLFQPSFDETFNVVTADGIAVGVPTVAASSIEWTPRTWWAIPEDPSSLVSVGLALLHDKNAINEARRLLIDYVDSGVRMWERYLHGGKPSK
jgi:hypothetical protein